MSSLLPQGLCTCLPFPHWSFFQVSVDSLLQSTGHAPQTCLISEAKQGLAWVALGWEKGLLKCVHKRGQGDRRFKTMVENNNRRRGAISSRDRQLGVRPRIERGIVLLLRSCPLGEEQICFARLCAATWENQGEGQETTGRLACFSIWAPGKHPTPSELSRAGGAASGVLLVETEGLQAREFAISNWGWLVLEILQTTEATGFRCV